MNEKQIIARLKKNTKPYSDLPKEIRDWMKWQNMSAFLYYDTIKRKWLQNEDDFFLSKTIFRVKKSIPKRIRIPLTCQPFPLDTKCEYQAFQIRNLSFHYTLAPSFIFRDDNGFKYRFVGFEFKNTTHLYPNYTLIGQQNTMELPVAAIFEKVRR